MKLLMRSLSPALSVAPLLVVLVSAVAAQDSELLPADLSIPEVIDRYIGEELQAEGVAAVAAASDHTVLRRTTLDLAGRIPTAAELQWYFDQPAEQRRQLLVDRLMQMPDFAYHQRNELDAMLLRNKPYDGEFREYLLWAARENRSWDSIFRDLMMAEENEAPQKGAKQFLLSRINEVDDLTNDTAILFFGVNISCAKCHDHPLVLDWQQDHFYGMQSFFSRTYKTKQNVIAEKLFDEVKFRTTAGEDKIASYMFLTGVVVDDGTPEFTDEERKSIEEKVRDAERKDDSEIPVADFSPRSQLIDVALKDDKEFFFSRNVANRIWARLMGTGIVDPLDQMHSGNPPSHPELLDWLARDLRQHNYDLARLIRGIVLSETYARSSEWSSGDQPPGAQLFAVAKVRPLTPGQLALSLQVCGRNPEKWPTTENDETWPKTREDLENHSNGWVREFEQPREGFQVAVDEALFFSNNSRMENDILRDSGDRLVGYLKSVEDDQQMIDGLWKSVLSRLPTEDEKQSASDWLGRNENRQESIRQLAWALIAGPEFRFNH
jgi:hypothetical protein